MKKLAAVLAQLPKLALLEVLHLYDAYPARLLTVVASAVVYVARTQGIVVDQGSTAHALGEVLPILFAGAAIHRKVKPVS